MSEEEIVEQIVEETPAVIDAEVVEVETEEIPVAAAEEVVEVVSSAEVPVEVVEEIQASPVKSKKQEAASVVQAFAQASWVGEVPNLTDEVHLSSMVYESSSRNSLSVAQVQVRLGVLGFSDSATDTLGWFSEGTRKALRDFQTFNALPITGEADKQTLEALFLGTTIEIVE